MQGLIPRIFNGCQSEQGRYDVGRILDKKGKQMGKKFAIWQQRSGESPATAEAVADILLRNRQFSPVDSLNYGDHGLEAALATVMRAVKGGRRIALYADYDVDGTMSCVSWIWFFRAIGFDNVTYYIPDRFREGYGLNIEAVRHLIESEKAELIITMDTGITANAEAALCKQYGVDFLCTDHHKIQPDKMPDCVILNPKQHPDADYQELCGCGITFVLLRQLGRHFEVSAEVWTDLLALTGMATICDVVPLNGVNHRLARMGVDALLRSRRPVLKELLRACAVQSDGDEKDIGFRLGPRINAVGRLEHAHAVIKAFVEEDPSDLVEKMGECNERRKTIQRHIVAEAGALALTALDDPILFLGGDWHQGVVGIAASKIAEQHWRPTWLFQRKGDECKGSARSIPGFDVTEAMASVGHLFAKFGGHRAAGGFSFPAAAEMEIRAGLCAYAKEQQRLHPEQWQSRIDYDCLLPLPLANLDLLDHLDHLKPFGHGFEEPKFLIAGKIVDRRIYNDKKTAEPRHTALTIQSANSSPHRVMFFNEVLNDVEPGSERKILVSLSRDRFRGENRVSMFGVDYL